MKAVEEDDVLVLFNHISHTSSGHLKMLSYISEHGLEVYSSPGQISRALPHQALLQGFGWTSTKALPRHNQTFSETQHLEAAALTHYSQPQVDQLAPHSSSQA